MIVSSCGIIFVFLFQCVSFCGAKSYNISDLKGIYSFEQSKKTPPTTTLSSWKLGICESLEESEDCPAGLDICGVIKIISDLNMIVSNVLNVPSSAKKEIQGEKDQFPYSLVYEDIKYGDEPLDIYIDLVCPSKENRDKPGNRIYSVTWCEDFLAISLETKFACEKDNYVNDRDSKSWGWLTWMFVFLFLFLSIYIIGGAWFQYTRGNSIDFQSALREVLENFISLIKGLPGFTKEIIEKFTGNGDRGEYSAI